MTDLERRLARLEAARGTAEAMVERELSAEAQELLRDTLAGLCPAPEIHATRYVGPMLLLSEAGRRQLEDTIARLGKPAPGRRVGPPMT